jgi:hypothetical protein
MQLPISFIKRSLNLRLRLDQSTKGLENYHHPDITRNITKEADATSLGRIWVATIVLI